MFGDWLAGITERRRRLGAEFLIGGFHSTPAIAAAMLNSRASPVQLFTRVRKSL
jgi:hypothetical protein